MFDVTVEDSYLNTLKQNPEKKFRIGDVAKFLDVKIHVVRYWENEFKNFIHAQKTSGGHNLYSAKDIDVFSAVKKLLYSEGYNITGARKKLREDHINAGNENSKTVSRQLLIVVKEELNDIKNDLKKFKNSLNIKS
ncbi:MAG: MerR family transcriptional regulator [Proteobacteria bacterium]|nr:MerR family transcriptional regulator [Pseudomonadota bacterium]